MEVLKGPLAVVRYVSLAMDAIRLVLTVGLERQKKHSCGPGGGLWWRERLWGR